MINIKKSKDGLFFVTYHAKNGEILATSEMLKSKQSAWKNITSVYKIFPEKPAPNHVYVTDMTGKKEQLHMYDLTDKKKVKK